jgi:hypothetical protein
MKTIHVLMLAGAILGAAWILKPEPVKQISQAALEEREKLDRWVKDTVMEERVKQCVASIGKTIETLDRSDPKQEAPYRKCMWPEESQSRLSRIWDKIKFWQ